MNFIRDQFRIPTREEMDSGWFHVWMLLIVGMLLAFVLGNCVGRMGW